MDWKDRIVVVNGKPTVKGTRLAVDFILKVLLEQGKDEVLKAHPELTEEDLGACTSNMMDRIKRADERERAFPGPWPSRVLSELTGLTWRAGQTPEEINSDDDPPYQYDPHREVIPIDEYLGLYDPSKREIILFNKAIASA